MVIHHAVINKRKDVCKLLFEQEGALDVNALDKV